jgi:maleate isomerase
LSSSRELNRPVLGSIGVQHDRRTDVAAPKRVGVLVPASNAIVEPELSALAWHGVTVHFGRVGVDVELTDGALAHTTRDLAREARKLALVGLAALGYACTSGSFQGSGRVDATLVNRLSRASGVPATTATTAALHVLAQLGARRPVFCSPYEQRVHDRGVTYFHEAGLDVLSGACLGLSSNHEIAAVGSDEVAELVRASDDPAADAIFISCTGLGTASILGALGDELGKPVLSSNSVLASHIAELARTPRPERLPTPP